MANKNYEHVLPTFLPDGREVDVQYCYDPAEWPDTPNGTKAITLWDVVAVDGESLILTLPKEITSALEAECLADVEYWKTQRRLYPV